MDIKPAIAVLFGTVIVAAALKMLTASFHPHVFNTLAYSCFPIVSVVLWKHANAHIPPARFSSRRYTAKLLLSFKSMAFGVVVFSFAVGLLMAFDYGVFTLSLPYLAITHMLTIAVCVPFIVIACYRQRDFDFMGMWFVVLLAIAAGTVFAASPIAGAEEVSFAVFTAAQMFVVAFLWLALADVAHHCGYVSDAVFGFGWTLYALPSGLGLLLGQNASCWFDKVLFSLIVLFILMVVLYLFMRERQPYNIRLFQDLNPPLSGDRLSQLTEQVDKLALLYDITDREKDVIILYAQGRSRAFISSKLFISENTARDHLKNVYKKMRIHNKQELIDKIEEMS